MAESGEPRIRRPSGGADSDRMEGLRSKVDRGTYAVDPRAIAEAILARRHGGGLRALCSEMLIAAQLGATDAPKPDALAGDDSA